MAGSHTFEHTFEKPGIGDVVHWHETRPLPTGDRTVSPISLMILFLSSQSSEIVSKRL
ncbi:hypothetical protein GCM10023194_80880 [Planotetraspora phitsanulokensis]